MVIFGTKITLDNMPNKKGGIEMKVYKIDTMTTIGKKVLKSIGEKVFYDKEEAWDYVGYLDERYPQGHFVVITEEKGEQ